MKTSGELDKNDENCHYEAPETFIRQMLHLYSKGIMNDENMLDNAFFMIAAGSESATLTISFAVLLLSMHPDVQLRAVAEVDRIFASLAPNEDLNYKHISKLEFLDQVVRETLRY